MWLVVAVIWPRLCLLLTLKYLVRQLKIPSKHLCNKYCCKKKCPNRFVPFGINRKKGTNHKFLCRQGRNLKKGTSYQDIPDINYHT